MTAAASPLEIVRPDHPRGPFRCAVLDFDGTLSLLRADWQGLMVGLGVRILAATGTTETQAVLHDLVQEFVVRLTGQPTILQMQALADEVARRGQKPRDVSAYLDEYSTLLLQQAQERIDAIRSGRSQPAEHMVPGSQQLLETLQARGLLLVLVTGSELSHVQHEAEVLGLTPFFGPRIYGPVDNDPHFAKRLVLRQLLAERGLRGDQIVAIGDGPAEMLAAREVGGLAIGVASDEVVRDGRINSLKRDHLLRSGVDVIVPDYRDLGSLLRILGIEREDGEAERQRE